MGVLPSYRRPRNSKNVADTKGLPTQLSVTPVDSHSKKGAQTPLFILSLGRLSKIYNQKLAKKSLPFWRLKCFLLAGENTSSKISPKERPLSWAIISGLPLNLPNPLQVLPLPNKMFPTPSSPSTKSKAFLRKNPPCKETPFAPSPQKAQRNSTHSQFFSSIRNLPGVPLKLNSRRVPN